MTLLNVRLGRLTQFSVDEGPYNTTDSPSSEKRLCVQAWYSS